jgi:hypothetical protein
MKTYKIPRKQVLLVDSEPLQTEPPIVGRLEPATLVIKRSNDSSKQSIEFNHLKKQLAEPNLIKMLSIPNMEHSQTNSSQTQMPSTTTEAQMIIQSNTFHDKLSTDDDPLYTIKNIATLSREERVFSSPKKTPTNKHLSPLSVASTPMSNECKFNKSCFNFLTNKRSWKYSDYSPLVLPFKLGTMTEYRNDVSKTTSHPFYNQYFSHNYSYKHVNQQKNSYIFPLSKICEEVILKKYGAIRSARQLPKKNVCRHLLSHAIRNEDSSSNKKAKLLNINMKEENYARDYMKVASGTHSTPFIKIKEKAPLPKNSDLYKIVMILYRF